MSSHHHQHIATVMQVATDGAHATAAAGHEQVIRDSWHRCVHQHRLDPSRMQEAIILPQARLREHQDQMEALLQIARHGLESLYSKVAGLGYVVLLTDARGITVDFLGDLVFEPSLRKAGLYLGADWSEHNAGTCGVGTCISTGQALTVHLDDHFDATHIPLTCTTAPVFDSAGQLSAVLDISQLSSSQPKASQHLALQLVKMCAHDIENAAFLHRHRPTGFCACRPPRSSSTCSPTTCWRWMPAVAWWATTGGRSWHCRAGATAPCRCWAWSFEALFDLPFDQIGRFVQTQPSDQRAVMLAGGRQLLFLSASPPPTPPVAAVPREHRVPPALAALSGGDAVLDRQIERVARLVNTPIGLLITGETGSGKEVFAKAVHAASERRTRPFVAVNCAAIPEHLIESELFGHLPGSFSGASPKGKRGLIVEADGGTLFLDEIGDMPLALQARLLRVLSEREVLPVGATRPVSVNIRVIAATHAPLETLVLQRRFRDDLYYRLKGAHIELPPLRARSDLAAMITRLLNGHAITPVALQRLLAHGWPGNLRELRNVLDYATSLCVNGAIDLDDLPELRATGLPVCVEGVTKAASGDGPEVLLQALRGAQWNVSAVARQLGLSRMTLYRRMNKMGIVPPNRMD